MPKRPKSGPPYTDIPNEVYVVVAYPWGMDRSPRSRGNQDYDRVASWAQFVLKQSGLGGGRLATIECIYSMGTRDEIIIQFEEGTNVIPLLGEHRWANIARNWQGNPNDDRSTRVFLYNWRDNGDPANHNWSEIFPKCLPLESVPAKSPYPTPTWTPPSSSFANLVIPIPKPPNPPPAPKHGNAPNQEQQTTTLPPTTGTPSPGPLVHEDQLENEEPATANDSVSSSLFRPYQPPSHLPAHARFSNRQTKSQDTSSSQNSPQPPKFIKKLDPYELGNTEEEALSILRAPDTIQEDIKHVKNENIEPMLTLSVKVENLVVKLEDGPRPAPQVVPPASRGYHPSAELEAYVNAHLQGATAPSSGIAQATPRSRVTVKREHEEDLSASLVERKRIKIEEI